GLDMPSAMKSAFHHYAELFLAMDDPYLRARHEDIRHLGNRLYGTWSGSRNNGRQELPDGPLVLVGGEVSVSDIAAVPRERLAAIACVRGSALSHTAVLANALGIPSVMGLGEVRGLRDGESVLVDGDTGRVFPDPDPALLATYRENAANEEALQGRLQELRNEPALTRDGERVLLYANSGLLSDISPGLVSGAEGLGLYRTEIPFMLGDTFPSEEEQFEIYRQVCEAYRDKPVHMRILDIGGDKPLPYFPLVEENPALGWRGIRFCLDNASLLMTQVRAMLRAGAGTGNLRVLLPMVSSTGELQRFHALLDDALAQLAAEDIVVNRPEVGIMVEVPAAISQLAQWRGYIDFVSIGSNDLGQYLVAADRNNPRVSEVCDRLHPAVLREIERIIVTARELNLPASLCGEMSSDPAAVVLLLGMGLRCMSLSAARLPMIKWLVRAARADDAAALWASAKTLPDAAGIRHTTAEYLAGLNLAGLPFET
ncbi:MAG: phosphoenolpyruvate--protein phosphotransferase, partial [Halioglobus sp.]|nr:phosphoenolpyruvate--protein phosphotransferase [Halioglobus sp.]